ncbi:MAG: sulfotransferase [Planctomycetota bacterium]
MDKARRKASKDKKRKQTRKSGPEAAVRSADQCLRESLTLLREGHPRKAELILRDGLDRNPDTVELYANMLLALENQGKHSQALALARQAVERFPENAVAHDNLGALLKFAGHLDEARGHFRRAVQLAPAHSEFWRNLTSVTRYERGDDPDIVEMRNHAERMNLMPNVNPSMFFALGKALEDAGEYDEAFRWYGKGNRARRHRIQYDPRNLESMTNLLIEVLGQEFFDRKVDVPTSQERPIFVVGMPRSGSTLVEQILASHPEVNGVGEIPDLGATLGSLSETTAGRIRAVAEASGAELARLGRVYMDRLRKHGGDAPRIVDKFLANFLHLGFIHKALPGARIVYTTRDAMDNCLACYKVLFTSNLPYAYNLEEIAHYLHCVQRVMDHWRKFMPEQILTVAYEDMVADPEAQSRRLLEFLGLPWDERVLRFHETERRVDSASSTQVRRPIYKDSVAKWKKFEGHLQPLQEFMKRAGMLAE